MISPGAPLAGFLTTAFPGSVPQRGRFIVILHGYFDESGTHDDSETLTVAGYLSTPERWMELEKDWKAALEHYGLEFFHMADFVNGAPPYKDWKSEDKAECFDRLVGIINVHTLLSIGHSFLVPRYRAIVSPMARRAAGGPYGLAANCCMMDVAEYLRLENPEGWVRYTFESGARGAGEVLKNFQLNMRFPQQKEHYRLLGLSFEGKRDFLPLQAADILAYELYRHLPRQYGIDQRSGIRRELKMLSVGAKRWWRIDDEELAKWSRVLEAYAKFKKLPKKVRREMFREHPPWEPWK